MYVVIFKAQIRELDSEYSHTAGAMRELAEKEYGCLNFHAVTEGNQEVALSYWPDLESIRAWQQDPQHQQAQRRGQQSWYKNYTVEIAEVQREYSRVL